MTRSILTNLLLGTLALGLVAAVACQKKADTATAQPAEATPAPAAASPAEPAEKPDAEAEAADAEAAAAAEKRARTPRRIDARSPADSRVGVPPPTEIDCSGAANGTARPISATSAAV